MKEAGNPETRLGQFLGSPSLSDDLKCQKSNKDWVTLAHLNQSTDLDNVFGCDSLIETSTGGEKLLFLGHSDVSGTYKSSLESIQRKPRGLFTLDFSTNLKSSDILL